MLNVKDLENRLRKCELALGGATKIKRKKVSPLDPRTKERLALGCMRGGDRMNGHGYAKIYAQYLLPYVGKRFSLVEVGVLTGSGIALWQSIFKSADIIGLDIDLGNFYNSVEKLKKRGAYRERVPEVHEFDQLADVKTQVNDIFKARKLDVIIDDGLHSNNAIMKTFAGFFNNLSKDFIYFIEDNATVSGMLREEFSEIIVKEYKTGSKYNDVLVVVTRRK